MPFTVRRVEYFTATATDRPGERTRVLTQLSDLGVNLLAFTAVPMGPVHTQMTIMPFEGANLARAAEKIGLVMNGPHAALLVQGDDELGALASVHRKLHEANVSVYASNGLADGRGGYGYVLYVRPDDYERAAAALGL